MMLKCIRNLFPTHTFRGKVESLSPVMLKENPIVQFRREKTRLED